MLGKYDEKQETVLTLNHVGIISVDEERKKELIKRKLAATLGGVAADAVEQSASVTKKTLAEFMTKAEVLEKEASSVAFNKPKKRRKKIREKKIDLDELEADAPEGIWHADTAAISGLTLTIPSLIEYSECRRK